MAPKLPPDSRLVFLDLETTGLSPENDIILEIGIVIVSASGVVTADVWSTAIKAAPLELLRMDEYVRIMHTKSGLLDALGSGMALGNAETAALGLLVANGFVSDRTTMAGCSPHFDRAFLRKHMPALDRFFSYRMIDVSTLRGLASRHTDPQIELRLKALFGEPKHRAVQDCLTAINELNLYSNSFLDPSGLHAALRDLELDLL